jgi:nucleotide-binding universal stress UspA family protein
MTNATVIIAAIDNSPAARPVVLTAVALAPVFGTTVEAVHVAEDGCMTARACAEALGVPFQRLEGDAFTRLTEVMAEDWVAALVVGVRSLPNKRRSGHLAIALASTLDKPVVVVPPQAQPVAVIHSVLLGIEGTPSKARALKRVVTIATGADLRLTVVHVDDAASIPSFSDQTQHETEAYAREFLARHVSGAPDAELELRIGDPAEQILGLAETLAPEMIAVGWPHSADPTRGLVAKTVVDYSRVPVMLVATD